MIYRDLGKTGMKVSEVGLGGENVTKSSYEITKVIVDVADEKGMNIIDAFMPQSEVRSHFGQALDGRRERFIIQGHLGSILKNGQYFRTREVRDSEEYLNDFLTRFRTDYIDVGVMHYVDTLEDYDKIFNSDFITFVLKLKRDGVIRALGASSHNPVTARKLAESRVIDVILYSINPAFDLMPAETLVGEYQSEKTFKNKEFVMDPRRDEFYKSCEKLGVGITVMKTFGAGRMLKAETSPFGFAMTPYQLIQYALDRPAVASTLVGARTPEEMSYSLAFEEASSEEKDYSVIYQGIRAAMGERCMYCNHCLPCPRNIDIADVTKFTDLIGENGESDSVRAHYAALIAHGGDCVGCGACETRCPFHVSIRENMARARATFGY